MNTINSIEKIILNKDIRSISKLKNLLGNNFVSDAAERILVNKGTVFISTGFYIVYANAPETDGPPGSIALGNALKKLGYKVIYVTDKLSFNILKGMTKYKIIEYTVENH